MLFQISTSMPIDRRKLFGRIPPALTITASLGNVISWPACFTITSLGRISRTWELRSTLSCPLVAYDKHTARRFVQVPGITSLGLFIHPAPPNALPVRRTTPLRAGCFGSRIAPGTFAVRLAVPLAGRA